VCIIVIPKKKTCRPTNLSEFHAIEFVLADCHIPHTNYRAGSCSDDGREVGAGSAQRLTPVTQTLTHSKVLVIKKKSGIHHYLHSDVLSMSEYLNRHSSCGYHTHQLLFMEKKKKKKRLIKAYTH